MATMANIDWKRWTPWLVGAGAGIVLVAIAWPRKASAMTEIPPPRLPPPSGQQPAIVDQAMQQGMAYAPFSPEANALFTQAARAAGLPESWGTDPGLHNILTKESGGWVGRPNYQFGDRAQLYRWRDWPQIWAAIRNGTWRDMLEGIITRPAATRNGIDSSLVGRPYKDAPHGKQSSATGLGQLTMTNINSGKYYPRNLDSIGVAQEEAIGMLKYIKDRHTDPTNAWAKYNQGVGEGY